MRDPRFQVRSLTGFTGGAYGGGSRKEATTFYVMDTAYCWEIVARRQTEHEAQWEADRLNRRYPGLVK